MIHARSRFARHAVVLALAGLALAGGSGCYGTPCEEFPDWCASGGAGTGGTGQGAGGAGGSSTTGVLDECDPESLAPGAAIPATCGLFVEPGATGGDGTQAAPFGSLGAALAIARANTNIYVCAGATPLDEAVEISSSVNVLGSVTCDTWKKASGKTEWTAAPNKVPLRIAASASGSVVQGFAITASDASDFDVATLQGHSSIAVVIDGATVTLRTCDLVAGAGAAGGDGEDIAGQAPGRQSDATMFDGNMGGACGANAGSSKLATCGASQTIGGAGGKGDLAGGASGVAGSPDPALGEPNGSAGLGDSGSGAWSCSSNGGNGEFGHDGPLGDAGAGGIADGALTSSDLFAGAAAQPGATGTLGQGGGGGGGLRGNGSNGCMTGVAGPSGGSGGAGGCGGQGGGAGGAGGASIALVSLDATITLDGVTLTAKAGGVGGTGGEGQLGGSGGLAGLGGASLACDGGKGGNGGSGGPGGGGAGGPSLAIAFVGSAPAIDDAAMTVATTAAAGGAGGTGGLAGASWPIEKTHAF